MMISVLVVLGLAMLVKAVVLKGKARTPRSTEKQHEVQHEVQQERAGRCREAEREWMRSL